MEKIKLLVLSLAMCVLIGFNQAQAAIIASNPIYGSSSTSEGFTGTIYRFLYEPDPSAVNELFTSFNVKGNAEIEQISIIGSLTNDVIFSIYEKIAPIAANGDSVGNRVASYSVPFADLIYEPISSELSVIRYSLSKLLGLSTGEYYLGIQTIGVSRTSAGQDQGKSLWRKVTNDTFQKPFNVTLAYEFSGTSTPVPEPSTGLIGLLALGAVFLKRKIISRAVSL